MLSRKFRVLAVLAIIVAAVLAAFAADNRTKLKPAFNFFSPQQDVEIGRQSSREAERSLQMLNDRQATSYIESLGKSLARYAPNNNSAYVYQFKIVNDTAINAFALPGGFLYVNRGAITAADNEAQIAGVIAHEIGHVVMRHGTHQASRAYLAQAPLAILGGVVGGNAIGSVMGAVGGVGMNLLFLRYSRDMETQADLIGTQILHDAGYEPKAMVEFFEKIQAESKGRASQFVSDHPNPENRISNVQHEIEKLDGALPDPKSDTPDFQSVKSALMGMPAPSRSGRPTTGGTNRPTTNRNAGGPAIPSTHLRTYSGADIEFRYPDNWQQYGQGSSITVAPDGGMVNGSLTWGLMISPFDPERAQKPVSLDDATDALLSVLQRNNSAMRITRTRESIRVGDRSGYVTEASNDSPAGGRETDWIVTTIAPDGAIYYFVGVAPQNDFNTYNLAFQDIVDTVKFRN